MKSAALGLRVARSLSVHHGMIRLAPFAVVVRACSRGSPKEFMDVPGVKVGGEKMVMMYTCKICDTRSAKKISKGSYEKGVVVVRCAQCSSMHLIADHLGVFEDPGWDINKFLKQQEGQGIKHINDENVVELTLEDITGSKSTPAVR